MNSNQKELKIRSIEKMDEFPQKDRVQDLKCGAAKLLEYEQVNHIDNLLTQFRVILKQVDSDYSCYKSAL